MIKKIIQKKQLSPSQFKESDFEGQFWYRISVEWNVERRSVLPADQSCIVGWCEGSRLKKSRRKIAIMCKDEFGKFWFLVSK